MYKMQLIYNDKNIFPIYITGFKVIGRKHIFLIKQVNIQLRVIWLKVWSTYLEPLILFDVILLYSLKIVTSYNTNKYKEYTKMVIDFGKPFSFTFPRFKMERNVSYEVYHYIVVYTITSYGKKLVFSSILSSFVIMAHFQYSISLLARTCVGMC